MIIVRPGRSTDLDGVYALACQAKTGLTTLPADRDFLANRLADSEPNFQHLPRRPRGELFFFVMEDLTTHDIIGTAAIFSKVGGFEPFWTYELMTTTKHCDVLGVHKDIQYLQLKAIHDGPSEIGTLFLAPSHRQGHNGRLLSLSRFLFMAAYPHCFEERVLAEMRGSIDDDGRAVFWEAVGAHFFGVPFAVADMMVTRDRSIIADLMPRHPIYIPLLPADAQSVIGVVHADTKPARALLEQEGFRYINEVDIFEAGPVLGADVRALRTVRDSRTAEVTDIGDSDDGCPYILMNACSAEHYAATVTSLAISNSGVRLPQDVAQALGLDIGSRVRYVPLRANHPR